MALNVRFSDLRQVVIPGILNRIEGDSSKMAGTAKVVSCDRYAVKLLKSLTHHFLKTISRWAGLLKHFVHSEEDQIDCLDITMVTKPFSSFFSPFVSKPFF